MPIRDRLERLASGRNQLILLVLTLIFTFVIFPPFIGQIARLASGGEGLIDTEFGYTPERALQMVAAYGHEGRLLYAITTLTADLLYPLVYSLFMALVLVFSFGRVFPPASPLQGLVYLPFAAAAADYLENASVLALLGTYPQQYLWVAWCASIFTRLKWGLFLLSVTLAMFGMAAWVVKKYRERGA